MRDNKIIIILVLVLLLSLGGLYYFLFANKSQSPAENLASSSLEDSISVISAEELGLTFVARSDKKAVKFSIVNVSGIESVEYEVTYLAEGDIPRGVIGTLTVQGAKSLESGYIDLGTCSSGRCKYDEGVTTVNLLLKVTKTDGSIYKAEQTLEL